MDETVKFTVEFNTSAGVAGAKEFQRALEGIATTSKGIGQANPLGAIQSALGGLGPMAAAAGTALAGVAAAVLSVSKAVDFLQAGIKNADYLRDLRLSMDALTGSTEEGAKAFARLEEAGKKTRVTGDELIKMFGESLPLALKRGFSVEAAEKWVTQIAKAAPALGMSVQQAMDQANQILAGRVRSTNVLAAAIGLDPKAYTAGLQNLSSVFDKVNEVAAAGEKMGQTFETAAHKIKDELLDAFSEGFNEARGGVDTGINSIVEAFRNPELLDAIGDLGRAVADILPIVIETFIKVIEATTRMLNDIRALVALFRGDMDALQDATQKGAPKFLPPVQMEIQQQVAAIAGVQQQGPQLPGQGLKFSAGVATGAPLPVLDLAQMAEQIKLGKEWNSTLDSRTDKTKNVIDVENKFAGTLDKSVAAVRDAEMAYKKLFTPPETNPLLRQLQQLDEQTEGFVNRMNDLAAGLRAGALKQGIPPEVAVGMNDAAKALEALGKKSAEGRAEMAAWNQERFFEKAMEANEIAARDAATAMDDFIESTTQQFNLEGMSGLAEGIRRQLQAINREMKEKVSVAKWLGMSPEAIAQIGKDAQKAAQTIVSSVDPVLAVASEKWKKQFAQLLSTRLPAGVTLQQAAAPMAEEFIKTLQIHLGISAEEAGQIFNKMSVDGWDEASKKAAAEFQAVFDSFTDTLSSALVGFAEEGGAGFVRAMSAEFDNLMQGGADTLTSRFAEGLIGIFSGGKGLTQAAGESDTEFQARQATAGKVMATVQGAMSMVGETMAIMKEASLGKAPDVGMTTLSFALTGAAIGSAWPGIGTAIGAVVGAAIGLFVGTTAKKKAEEALAYGAYGIEGGEPFIVAAQGRIKQFNNITEGMMEDMLSQMTHTLEDTQNSYVKLLLKFPASIWSEVVSGLGGAEFQGTMTPRGHFEGASYDTMATFHQDFAHWAENTLPREIVETFEEPLSRGFEALGLQAERFSQIWKRIHDIDPKEAIATLNNLYDALVAFRELEEFARPGRELYGAAGFEFEGGYLDEARRQSAQSFAEALADADVNLVEMGNSLNYLIGPEQIAQAAELGKLLQQRQQEVEDFFQAIAQAIDSTIATYQAQIRELQLEGMVMEEGGPDTQRQIDFLKKYADGLWGKIATATTPEQIAMYSDELMQTILRIKQLGGTLGEDAAEAYRLWAIENLQNAQDLVVGRLEELAQMVADQNELFLDAIQDFIEAFREATDAITDETEENGNGGPPGTEPLPPGGTNGNGTHPNRERYPPLEIPPPVTEPTPPPPGGGYVPKGTTSVPTIQTDQREIILLLTDVRDRLRDHEVIVRNKLEVEVEGETVVFESAPTDTGGFERREIAARNRG